MIWKETKQLHISFTIYSKKAARPQPHPPLQKETSPPRSTAHFLHLKALSDAINDEDDDEQEYAQSKLAQLGRAQRSSYDQKAELLQLEMDRIFDCVSNDTNSLISSLCANNVNVSDFLAGHLESETGNLVICN